jgi:hypothetical protein
MYRSPRALLIDAGNREHRAGGEGERILDPVGGGHGPPAAGVAVVGGGDAVIARSGVPSAEK